MKCKNCGNELKDLSRFCPYCGVRLRAENTKPAHRVGGDIYTRPSISSHDIKVGGWIIVFCIIITITIPASIYSDLSEYLNAPAKYGIDEESRLYRGLGVSRMALLFVGFYSFFSGVAIWSGSRNGKKIAIAFLLTYPSSTIVFNLVSLELIKGAGSATVGLELVREIIVSVTFSAIWLAYFRWSERVKVTYG